MSGFGTAIPEVIVHTDGGSRGNGSEDSIGAYGYVIEHKHETLEGSKAFRNVTNNQMELLAVIKALEKVKESIGSNKNTKVCSDSKYVITGITEWRFGWERNGWQNSKKKEVLNKDLWQLLCNRVDSFTNIQWEWIKGHQDNGNLNDRADELCNIKMDELAFKSNDSVLESKSEGE